MNPLYVFFFVLTTQHVDMGLFLEICGWKHTLIFNKSEGVFGMDGVFSIGVLYSGTQILYFMGL